MKRSGFTLVEILVVTGIMAILITILIPVLGSVMRARNDITDLSNLRQCMVDFSVYAIDNKNRFVNAGPPHAVDRSVLYYGENASIDQVVNSYGGQVFSWPNVLFNWSRAGERHWHSSYEEMPELTPEIVSAWDSYLGGGWTGINFINGSNYWYSMTMLTRSSAWTATGVRGDRTEIAARYYDYVYHSQVSFPSSKAVLIQTDRPHSHQEKHYAFADGSVSLMNSSDAKPMAVPLEANQGSGPGAPGLSTLNGYEGIDF